MKKITLLIFAVALTRSLIAQQVWKDQSRLLPDRLRNIPTGIQVWHSPSPVYPVFNTDTAYAAKYIWKHSTRVNTENGDLKVVAAGSYIWYKNKGWITNIVLDNGSFAKYFHCKNGLLIKGKYYTFLKNFRTGDALYAGDALWFVLAKDKEGRIYKGIAIVETEGTLENKN